jgi:hypothetical protein
MAKGTITIRIQAWQRVRYDQTIEVGKEDAKELLAALKDAEEGGFKEERKLGEIADGFLDHMDIEDGEDLTDVEVERVKATSRGTRRGSNG